MTLNQMMIEVWETATNSVCQTMKENERCDCERGYCKVNISPSDKDRKLFETLYHEFRRTVS